MKKIFTLLLLFTLLPLLLSAKGTVTIGGSPYTADTLAHYKVGPGTYHTYVHFSGPKDMRAFYLEIDATNPYISFQSVLGRDSIVTCEGITNMAARKSQPGSRYFAGTNADFFATSGAIGTPVHGFASGGQLGKVPVSSGPQTAFTHNDECYISFVTFYGQVTYNNATYGIHSVNGSRGTDQLVLYNRYVGHYTHTNAYGYEVPVSLADGETWGLNRAVKIVVSGAGNTAGNMEIAENGAVLSGHGASADFLKTLQPGDELEMKLLLQLEDGTYPDINCMIGGDRKILGNGQVLDTDWAELHPRTSIGYSADRSKVYMLVVDGRQSGYSDGATTKQMADMLKLAGAADGMNLDGGGSSGMYIEQYGLVNSPSDGHERAVSNGIFVVSNAPDDNNIAEILCTQEYCVLPKYGVFTPHFMGYNQYGYLINTELTGVTLRCDESLGYIKDNTTLVASGEGRGKLYASYNGAETSVDIVIGAPEGLTLRLDSVINDCHYRYPVEVFMTNLKGEEVSIAPQMLSWRSSDEQVAVVEEGVLRGLASGVAEVYGSMSGFTDTLLVKVQEPVRHCMNLNDGSADWMRVSFVTSAGFKNTSVTNSVDKGLELSFLYNSPSAKTITLSGNIPLYSLPDTLRIRINPGAARLKSFSCTLRLPSGLRTIDLPVPAVNRESVADIVFPDALGETIDMANYPITLSYLTLGLDMNTLGETYHMTIPAVEVIYNYYNENASGIESVANAGLAWTVEGRTVLLGRTADRIELYNVGGGLVALARESDRISAPGVGLYVVRVVSDGQSVSQKIWITK